MLCPKCGSNNPDGGIQCGVCGEPLPKAESPNVDTDSRAALMNGAGQVKAAQTAQAPQSTGIVSGSLSDGWVAFKKRPGLLIGMLIAFYILNYFSLYLFMALTGENVQQASGGFLTFQLILAIINMTLFAGYTYTALNIIRGEQVSFATFFSGFPKILTIAVSFIIAMLIIYVGLLLLIVPGLIIAFGFSQILIMIVDMDYGPFEAIKKSWRMMRGYKFSYFLLILAMAGINLLGALALVVGLLVTIPLSYATMAAFYNRLMILNPPSD